MNSMLTAWQETILDYTFKVVYRPGVLNVLPDALSRQFPQELWTARIQGSAPSKIYGYVHLIQDADTQRVTTWPNLAKDCLEYVQRCQECQRVNIARKGYHPLTAIHAQLPGEHMAVDLTGPFPVESDGNLFLLILVDVCTSNFSDTTEKLSSQEELLKRLECMTKTVFPAIDTKTRETQRRMIERFNRTVLHSEFPDGAKVMSLDPILGDKLSPRIAISNAASSNGRDSRD
ncbi:hypothetical protein KI688_008866 [Linnemannia hyalina]|uniref:Integrase zinc-binding domain-containing protein n=1 Tax=Linnemannia hyalina TaxID=64524 RepID=A0A9P7XG89_9FUNG|nr:hypothetical protein KI688_008866 [Linnemannia hyalina]